MKNKILKAAFFVFSSVLIDGLCVLSMVWGFRDSGKHADTYWGNVYFVVDFIIAIASFFLIIAYPTLLWQFFYEQKNKIHEH